MALFVGIFVLLSVFCNVAFGKCPNLCSGHGICEPHNVCSCFDGWSIAADCSFRKNLLFHSCFSRFLHLSNHFLKDHVRKVRLGLIRHTTTTRPIKMWTVQMLDCVISPQDSANASRDTQETLASDVIIPF